MIELYSLISFVGNLLKGQTVCVIGAGRIGSAYARMMVIFTLSLYVIWQSPFNPL